MPLLHGDFLTDERCAALVKQLMELYDGDECVFTWAEHLRSELQADAAEDDSLSAAIAATALDDDSAAANTAAIEEASSVPDGTAAFTFEPATNRFGQRVRHFDASANDDAANGVEIISGASFHPPKSGPSEEFQAHVARVESMGQVQWVLARLLRDKRLARASHNMLAYRFVDERGVSVSDNDDDGESGSGAKLAALLDLAGVSNVLVVVSRWFGGVHLGPARFKYIASVARQLLEEAGYVGGGAKSSRQPPGKKK